MILSKKLSTDGRLRFINQDQMVSGPPQPDKKKKTSKASKLLKKFTSVGEDDFDHEAKSKTK